MKNKSKLRSVAKASVIARFVIEANSLKIDSYISNIARLIELKNRIDFAAAVPSKCFRIDGTIDYRRYKRYVLNDRYKNATTLKINIA